jgi:hypothetical protein
MTYKTLTLIVFISIVTASCENETYNEENTVEIFQEAPLLREVKSKEFFVNRIKEDSLLMEMIITKAKERNISNDEMIQIDAEYLQNEEAKITNIENDIIGKPDLLKSVKQKANEQGITIDDMLRMDAVFIYEENKKANPQ